MARLPRKAAGTTYPGKTCCEGLGDVWVYPTIWVRGWLLCATGGVCLAMLLWPPMVALSVSVVAVLGAGAYLARARRRLPDRLVLGDYGCSRLELSAALGLGLVGLRALGDVSPGLVLATLLALVLSHPKVVQAALRLVAPSATPPEAVVGGAGPGAAAVSPASLTTAELCEAWRDSFRLVSAAGSSQELQRAVVLRQGLLDEMARRDAAGLSAWLESGARPSGAPERYLRDGSFTEGE
jgi:hypothetical protein